MVKDLLGKAHNLVQPIDIFCLHLARDKISTVPLDMIDAWCLTRTEHFLQFVISGIVACPQYDIYGSQLLILSLRDLLLHIYLGGSRRCYAVNLAYALVPSCY